MLDAHETDLYHRGILVDIPDPAEFRGKGDQTDLSRHLRKHRLCKYLDFLAQRRTRDDPT